MESLYEVTNALSNGAIPNPLRPPLPQDWGFTTHTKTAITIISGTAKAIGNANLDDTFTGSIHPNTNPWKILEKRERGRIQRLPKFFWYPPTISGTGKATNLKRGRYIHRVHANKSPLKIWENRERWRIQGLPKFLKYSLLSQERVKLRMSNLADIFKGHANKSQVKIWEKMERGRIQGLPKFFEYPLLSQERVKLRTSNFVRTFLVSI